MNWLKSKKIIITHNGQFHADEVFAIACLTRLSEWRQAKLVRTRDNQIIVKGDLVVDIGGQYDVLKLRFDHHQIGGAGKRPNGIPYAGFGLVWKKFGLEICGGDQIMADLFENNFVLSVDAGDNGHELDVPNNPNIRQYSLDDMIRGFYPNFKENQKLEDKSFDQALKIAKQVVERELIRAKLISESLSYVESVYQSSSDKRILILDKPYPWKEAVFKYTEPLFMVVSNESNDTWGVRAVPINRSSFKLRASLPAIWGGLRDTDLAKVSGVEDAIFCHTNLFLAVAKSRVGAIKLAELALAQIK